MEKLHLFTSMPTPSCVSEGQVSSLVQVPTWVVEVELAFESLGLLLRGEDSVKAVLA